MLNSNMRDDTYYFLFGNHNFQVTTPIFDNTSINILGYNLINIINCKILT